LRKIKDGGFKMIQIDDAGSGSLVGGTYIGALRVETKEYYYDLIPIKLYNEKYFKKKFYLEYTNSIVKKAINVLKIDKAEPIMICQGYMFDDVRRYLSNNNYDYTSTKINEPLQSVIEKSFEDYSVSLGLPRDFLKYTKFPFHFHRLLRWVYADYNERNKLCKTGWKSWQKYGHLKLDCYNDFIYKSNYYCLKCGKKIHDFSDVKVIKYISNMNNMLYLHKTCP
jgi:hypothetical protein